MSENKQLMINVFANFIYLLINYAITFLLTSFIVSEISGEAYGFISLCNNVVNYATLITVALNSVAGRFIAIEMHQGNIEKANKYFSSTLAADVIICVCISGVFVPLANNIDLLFEIPSGLENDVRILFLLVTLNLVITVISAVYTVSTFITNKLYLSGIANAAGNIIRAVSLILFMCFGKPGIRYVGFATVLSSLFILLINIIYTRKLSPSLKIKKGDISFCCVKELLASGIWNSVTKMSQILSDGIDLVISNLWVGAYAMGQLSIAYTVPTIAAAFLSMIINVFNPKLTEFYAKGNKPMIIYQLKLNMKMTAFFGNVLFFGMVTMGRDFFELWVPSADNEMVYALMLLATVSLLVSSIVSPLSNVFLLTNRLKVNSLVWFGVSLFDAAFVVILVKTTSLGVYAVAGVSKVAGAIVNLVFLPLYASHCLKEKANVFYKLIGRYAVATAGVGITMVVARGLMGSANNWLFFILRTAALAILGMLFNYTFFLNKEERIYLKTTVIKKISKWRVDK